MKNEKKCIALIGFMATGKSTIGPLLARELEYDFIDTDAMVEAELGRPVSDIFTELGEDAFRDDGGLVPVVQKAAQVVDLVFP